MNRVEEIQDRIFLECKDLIKTLSEIKDKNDLIAHKILLHEITEKVSVLHYMSQTGDLFCSVFPEDTERVKMNVEGAVESHREEGFSSTDVSFKNQEFQIIEKEISISMEDGDIKSGNEGNCEPKYETQETFSFDRSELEHEEKLSVEEKLFCEEMQQKGKQILLDETEELKAQGESIEVHEETNHDKKIRLAHIRGLKNIQSLFDEELLDLREKPVSEFMADQEKGAGNHKALFKLDLNDRIAFSKMLFEGSQTELNQVVNTLNGFDTLDQAKEYLSEIYYEKNWEKVDEYAQRLWILVENKFV